MRRIAFTLLSSSGTSRRSNLHTRATIEPATEKLIQGVLNHERLALSRAITLVESSVKAHKEQAELLLDTVLKKRREEKKGHKTGPMEPLSSFRVGIAGPPGAGKSKPGTDVGMFHIH